MPDSLIVTISDSSNYGNRLQNYALSCLLSKYGEPSTSRFVLGITNRKDYILHEIKRFSHLSTLKHKFQRLIRPDDLEMTRMERMRRFTSCYVPDNRFEITEFAGLNPKPKGDKRYQIVVLGSDQIWNPNFMSSRELCLHLGASFVDSSVRVISYAASFGIASIRDTNTRAIFKRYLPLIADIAVREDAGQRLARELANCDATVVLDPTLMLPAEKWLSITRSFVPSDDRYVLTYFLGRPSDAQQSCINDYANQHGCRIRRILDLSDRETYIAGPEDFVELFSKAQYVFTDSYHACCFSILFHKQFTVFTRAGFAKGTSMNSRMETLFRLFELDSVVSDSDMAPEIDYSHVDELLATHRTESSRWLDRAMDITARN
ncbi:polysaccharide pyruvyl transferase family protein [Pseudoscardovia suis]|uniref:polysaccharide pyruvyl transferase family protein n=1 Tax=Pseudoscardovia suis TaxID=987063 RepID=UPI003F9B9448